MWDNYKYLFLLLILISITCCNTTEPPNDNQSINLKLEDVSCTEAWLKLTTTNLQLPTTVTLKQTNPTGDTKSQILNLNTQDSLLYIDSLLPNTSYQYKVSSIQCQISSNELSVTTMDTTSHNFTWQTWTFGEHSSSVLYDIAIIDENNIWAVGEIYMNDTLGQPDPNPYGIVHWNGFEWNVKRITAQNPSGGYSFIIPMGIFVLSPTEIWLARGGVFLFNGDSITQAFWLVNYSGYNGGIFSNGESASKLWGISPEDLYTVGFKGALAHFNGTSWRKIESGTDVDIQDIWGISDEGSGSFILCAVSNAIEPGEHKILRIINYAYVDTISWISNKRVHSIWMDSKYQVFACGDGVFKNNSANIWVEQDELTFVFTERVRGKSKNNLFVVGDFGFLAHYNGASWTEYPEASAALVYTSLDIKNNLVVTVGYTQTKAIIQIFTRN